MLETVTVSGLLVHINRCGYLQTGADGNFSFIVSFIHCRKSPVLGHLQTNANISSQQQEYDCCHLHCGI